MSERGRDRLRRIDGWTVANFELADGAYLGTYRQDERFDLTVRKGRFIAFVGGESKPDLERFAKYVLAAISEAE
jgi:hypothetical protein